MKKRGHFLILWLILLLPVYFNAQVIKGTVMDVNSNTTLPGATVYQDGTTNVTITDQNGYFELNTKGLNNTLVIRYLGYQSEQIDNPLRFEKKMLKVVLNEELFSLDEVVVVLNPSFTRREMLRAFRSQFLGTSKSALRCKIANEDDLILRYNADERTLTAL
jgi:hypothetical protein